MNKHTADTVIDAALHHLDFAPDTDLTEAERERADAAFARIVATPDDEPVGAESGRRHRRRNRMLVLLGLAGAAGVAVPAMLLGGGTAYGSWSPTPHPLTDVAAAEAATTCRILIGAPDRGERVAVAERRGGWTYVLLAGPRTEVVCLMPDDLVGQRHTAGGSFSGRYDPDAPAPPALAPDTIDETTSQEGSTDEGWFNSVEGYVGSDVTGVTVHTSSGLDIEASVVANRFAAWWPGTEQDSEHPAETWSYTVHLADGSTRRTR
ncbi:hypothetical protein ACVW00_003735 [Marmoricola sp. URHA0025 HA25]